MHQRQHRNTGPVFLVLAAVVILLFMGASNRIQTSVKPPTKVVTEESELKGLSGSLQGSTQSCGPDCDQDSELAHRQLIVQGADGIQGQWHHEHETWDTESEGLVGSAIRPERLQLRRRFNNLAKLSVGKDVNFKDSYGNQWWLRDYDLGYGSDTEGDDGANAGDDQGWGADDEETEHIVKETDQTCLMADVPLWTDGIRTNNPQADRWEGCHTPTFSKVEHLRLHFTDSITGTEHGGNHGSRGDDVKAASANAADASGSGDNKDGLQGTLAGTMASQRMCHVREYTVVTQQSEEEERMDFDDWEDAGSNGVPVGGDFLSTRCSAPDGLYFNFHTQVNRSAKAVARAVLERRKLRSMEVKPDVEVADGLEGGSTTETTMNETLNVVVLMMGGMSRNRFHRRMTRTQSWLDKDLKDAKSFEFSGYSAVGRGADPSLIGLITGYPEKRLPETRACEGTATHLDPLPNIFRDYAKSGYVTMDARSGCRPRLQTLSPRQLGYSKQMTDHSMDKFWCMTDVETARELGRATEQGQCVGHLTQHQLLLSYADSFHTAYAKSPRFTFIYDEFVPQAGHPISSVDEDLHKWLSHRQSKGLHHKSVVILMGDHGESQEERYAKKLYGKLETRSPLLKIIVPKWLLSLRPDIERNMRANRALLTTPYDVHMTLSHLMSLHTAFYSSEAVQVRSESGYSLMTRIPQRNCKEALVPLGFCKCLETVKVFDSDSHDVLLATQWALRWINQKSKATQSGSQCMFLTPDSARVTGMWRRQVPRATVQFLRTRDRDGYHPEFDTGISHDFYTIIVRFDIHSIRDQQLQQDLSLVRGKSVMRVVVQGHYDIHKRTLHEVKVRHVKVLQEQHCKPNEETKPYCLCNSPI